ncbi:MAG: plastocyanin/azurin family copper-binding protein [Patescibacteria group bacterium]
MNSRIIIIAIISALVFVGIVAVVNMQSRELDVPITNMNSTSTPMTTSNASTTMMHDDMENMDDMNAATSSVQATTSVKATTPKPTPSTTKPTTPIVKSTSNSVAVSIKGYDYWPKTLSVKKGTMVTWTNEDIAKHTVTGSNGGPASAFFGKGETYSYTFNETGTFEYFCEPHPYMKATVVVTQ